MQLQSFIDNSFYKGDSSFIKLNPYTLEQLHQVNSCDLIGLVMAIQAANRAFAEWKTSSLNDRIQLIEKIRNTLAAKQDEYALSEAADQALPLWFVKKNGIELSLKHMDMQLHAVRSFQQPEAMRFSAVGVVALISPWNLSLRVILDRLIPALLAGNAVVIKISSQAAATAQVLAEILTAAEAPRGLVNVLVTDDVEVKRALVSHPGVKAVSFAGSLETTGELLPILSKSALQNFKKIQISSGSKNSAVVLGEPDEELFTDVINSFVIGQGQLVWNSSRLFILEKFEALWVEKIRDYLAGLRPSESVGDSSPWTPCVKPASFVKFEEIRKMAIEDKAHLLETDFSLTAGQQKKYLSPVFTKDMSRCSTLQQDQIHSPVFILSTVKYPFDVAKYSNVSYFGFAAHLWGEPDKLLKVAEGLDVGLACFNQTSVEVPGAVISVKQSGFGIQDFNSFGAFYSNAKILT